MLIANLLVTVLVVEEETAVVAIIVAASTVGRVKVLFPAVAFACICVYPDVEPFNLTGMAYFLTQILFEMLIR